MTPTVVDNTAIPTKNLRRHSDSPSLWIAVTIGSASLHLLAFWLMRSYQTNLLWRPNTQTTIPIEVIEISPRSPTETKTKVKPAPIQSPQPVVPPQKQVAQPAPTDEQQNAIALAEQRQQELEAQRQRELEAQRQQELEAQRQQELEAQRQQELEAQRQQELEAQRQQELEAQRQQELEAQRQRQNRNNQDNPDPLAPPSNTAGGSLIASLVGEPQQGEKDRHTHPAKIKPSNQPFTKGLEYVKFIEKKPGEPVDLKVILTISEQGKLENVMIADQAIAEPEKSYYEDFVANEVLKGWEFEPAYDNDPNDPKPSNLTVLIRIETLP
jgi:hypothetical protein